MTRWITTPEELVGELARLTYACQCSCHWWPDVAHDSPCCSSSSLEWTADGYRPWPEPGPEDEDDDDIVADGISQEGWW